MIFKNLCVLVLWTKVALALEGLSQYILFAGLKGGNMRSFTSHVFIHDYLIIAIVVIVLTKTRVSLFRCIDHTPEKQCLLYPLQ